ncbi:MAG: low molecular weight phosphotyrosine protein phosphatase, partial [Acidaminococcaceae bacterium]|nr:low molecular weight phosphotyrosine protein phosphatase [Acidaminococcaceae bacterium]
MIKVLFICHGNICRSPAAEFVLRRLLDRAGLAAEYEVASAATSSEELGNPVYPPMRRVLTAHGLDCAGKTARQLRRRDYEDFDLLIGMDEENLWNMRRLFGGDPDSKLHSLMAYTDHPDHEIADPWYTRNFELAYEEIALACEGLLYHLTGV